MGGYSVSANSKHKELAAKVAAFMAEKMAEGRYMLCGNVISATLSPCMNLKVRTTTLGGNMEIGWTNGASFNRTVSGFGGTTNFITLNRVAVGRTGSYKARNSRKLKRWLRMSTGKDMPVYLNEYNWNTGNAYR